MISLIMGVYNPNPEWMKQALESSRGLFDETIIVDDGSDLPVERAIRTPHKGFWNAKNEAIANAKGKVIATLDSDDLLYPGGVKEFIEFVKNNDSDIWHFPIEMFGEEEGIIGNDPKLENLLIKNQIPGVSWYKKEVWEKLGGFRNVQAEDWDFWVRAWKAGMKFTYYPKSFYKYRRHINSASWNWTGDKFLEIRDEINKRYETKNSNAPYRLVSEPIQGG